MKDTHGSTHFVREAAQTPATAGGTLTTFPHFALYSLHTVYATITANNLVFSVYLATPGQWE